MFGLSDKDIEEIVYILQKFPEVKAAYIYGSRAKGNYKKGSDVDISLKGPALNFSIISKINLALNEETSMPFHFDVINYHDITNEDLINHIDRIGLLFYEKQKEVVVQEPENNYKNKPV